MRRYKVLRAGDGDCGQRSVPKSFDAADNTQTEDKASRTPVKIATNLIRFDRQAMNKKKNRSNMLRDVTSSEDRCCAGAAMAGIVTALWSAGRTAAEVANLNKPRCAWFHVFLERNQARELVGERQRSVHGVRPSAAPLSAIREDLIFIRGLYHQAAFKSTSPHLAG